MPRAGQGLRDGQGRIFYGWWILAASVVIELFGLGFGIFAVTTVYPYIIDAFPSWSRTVVFLPTSIMILTVGVMSPITGALIDRYPIRLLFVAGIIVQALALLLFARVQTPAQYLGASFLVGLGMSGVTILPNQVLVSRWFESRVGLVNGVILGATATGAAIAPALITRIIEASNWRSAFTWMAVAAFFPPMIVTLGIIRDSPASMGLRPYGASDDPTDAPAEAIGIGVREALRSRSFWVFAAVIFLGGMPCYSLNKHLLVMLKELGFDPIRAADWKSFFFAIAACSRVLFGWLSDRVDRRNLLVATLVLIASGYPLLRFADQPPLLALSLILVGVGYGGLLPAIPIMAVHYFGRLDLGKVLGVYKISYDVAAAVAPLLTAYLYDVYGGYGVGQVLNAGMSWIAVALTVMLLPRRGFTPARAVAPLAGTG